MDFFESWILDKPFFAHKALPCSILWGIWISKTKMKFQVLETTPRWVSLNNRISYGYCSRAPKQIVAIFLKDPTIDGIYPWGLFDEAC